MFYLTMHSTHFIYGYIASDIWLRTILIVRKETSCRHKGYSFFLAARVLLYAPSHRQDSTYHGYICGNSVHSWCNGSSDRSFMVDPLSYFSFQPVLRDWCNKGCGMCYPVCGMMLIGKSSPCCNSRFPLLLSDWSFTICLTPDNRI